MKLQILFCYTYMLHYEFQFSIKYVEVHLRFEIVKKNWRFCKKNEANPLINKEVGVAIVLRPVLGYVGRILFQVWILQKNLRILQKKRRKLINKWKSGCGNSAPPTFLVLFGYTWFKYEIFKKNEDFAKKMNKIHS